METVIQLKRRIIARLTPEVGDGEARAMADEIMLAVAGRDRLAVVLNPDQQLEPEKLRRVDRVVDRVVEGEPLQYVLGYARFGGLTFKVTPDVLIPRPETAQLVDIISDDIGDRADVDLLDLCTGSGCIACALARRLRFARVTAVDISSGALEVARTNARDLKVNVDFLMADVMTMPAQPASWDVIVSNPPYVVESERRDMESRVLDYEPGLALFIPDEDPLMFYRAIADYALSSLRRGGRLYFEINPLFADALAGMLKSMTWDRVEILTDFRGKRRFAVCRL